MTAPNYSYESQVGPWPLRVTSSDTIYPGDLLYWDSVTQTHRPLTDVTKGELFSGIALGQYPPSSNVDNSVNTPPPFVAASLDGLHSGQAGTAGDVMTFGMALYLGADSQTLTSTAPAGTDAADVVGYFWPNDGLEKTVAAGDQIQWRPRVNFPSPDLA